MELLTLLHYEIKIHAQSSSAVLEVGMLEVLSFQKLLRIHQLEKILPEALLKFVESTALMDLTWTG